MSARAGFDIRLAADGSTDLNVIGDWSADAELALASGQVQGLVLNYARGFRERDLGFIDRWPIRRLHILARTISDIQPIYRLSDSLQELGLVVAPQVRLDPERLPQLRHVWVENWETIRAGLRYAINLTQVGLGGYRKDDLSALAGLANLEEVRIKQARRLVTLNGIEPLNRLRRIEIAGAPNLADVTGLRSPRLTLDALKFETCGGITELSDIARQRQLRVLHVANCGPIDSLGPLTSLTRLEVLYLYESTRITDGDLTPLFELTGLTDLRIMNRRHYKPPVSEVKERLRLSA